MSPRLACTVRGCGAPLRVEGATLVCARSHAFDRAREGYWSLLQPQDRRSAEPGDRAEAAEARRRWLARGFADGLIATLARLVDTLGLPPGACAVDAGCGEGTLTTRVLGGRGLDLCGVDLSRSAIRMAARLDPGATWIVANADRDLPFESGSVALALSAFGRRAAAPLARILGETGVLVAVLPGPRDLAELRLAIQGEVRERDRVPAALEDLAPSFDLVARTRWTHRALHDRAALQDALAMSYRGARAAERTLREGLPPMELTLDAELLVLQSRGA